MENKYEVAQYDGKVYITLCDQELLKIFIKDVDELAKSNHYNNRIEDTFRLLEFQMALEKAAKEIKKEHPGPEKS